MNEKFYGGPQGRPVRDYGCGCETDMRQKKPGRRALLKKVQEYNFLMIETGLFLNNQPCCEAAQEAYCKYREMYLEAVAEYEECYGPLTYSGVNVKRDGWEWANSPWPWEVEGC